MSSFLIAYNILDLSSKLFISIIFFLLRQDYVTVKTYMYNNSLYGFHSCKFIPLKTQLCFKKITKEYRLVQNFNFIIDYEVSQSVLRCTRTDTFINKFSNLSALVHFSAQTFLSSCLDSTWFTITSKNTMTLRKLLFYQVEEFIASVDSSYGLT